MYKFNRGEEIIAAVKKRRPLWDPSTPLHKNVKVLVYLWKQVAQELKMDETTVKRKWKNIRDYFIRQTKELEKSNDRKDGSESDDLVSYKFCLWPLYEKLKFLTDQAQTLPTHRVKLMDDDYKIIEEINHDILQGNSNATETVETIIYHVPNGEASPLVGDDSDDCELVSVQSVQTIPESHTSKSAASTPAVASSTIDLSQVSGLSQTIGLSQYLPLQKIAPTVKSKQQLTQPNHQAPQPKVVPLTQDLLKLPVPKKLRKISKVQPKRQVAKDRPKQHKIIMLTATNPPPLSKIPPLKRARLTLDEEQNNDQPVVIPITTTSTTKRARLTLHDEQNEDQPVTIPTTTAITSETNDENNNADYQFFKSLLPFMKELPMKNRLRIRNCIQIFVLKEFESIEREKKLASISNKKLCSNEQIIELDSSPGSCEVSNRHTYVNVKEEDVEMADINDVLYEIKTETV